MRQVCDLSIHLQPRENTTTVPQPRYYSNKNWSWMNLYDSPKGVFWGSKTPLFRILGACSSTKHFVAIKINKIPQNLNVVFNVFAFWGSEAKLFPYIPNIHRFFLGGAVTFSEGWGYHWSLPASDAPASWLETKNSNLQVEKLV